MKLKDLTGLLERYEAEVGGEVEVRLMTQMQYPFEHALSGVTDTCAILDFTGKAPDTIAAEENIVYIVEGSQLGYGKKDAWETAER